MKTDQLVDTIGQLDDAIFDGISLFESDYKGDGGRSELVSVKKHMNPWMKWGSIVAALAILISGCLLILPSVLKGKNTSGEADERYKGYSVTTNESAILWPWEYETVPEKFNSIEIAGKLYNGKGREVSESLIDKKIGDFTVCGYDYITDEKHSEDCEVYSLKDVSQQKYIAMKIEGKYYVFMNGEYLPPSTLGELMDTVKLPAIVKLSHFSENGDSPVSKHYVLTDDSYIWEILSDCREAAFIDDQNWMGHDRDYLSFSITSETLGVYKVAMYITEDGYFWTNAFGWQYLFDIGKDAASKIIKYAKSNSSESTYEPYMKYVAGTIVNITDDYILIDDAILCKNPDDSIKYKVLLDDLRISRFIDKRLAKTGDIVQVSYQGTIDYENANLVENPVDISLAFISDGDVNVNE